MLDVIKLQSLGYRKFNGVCFYVSMSCFLIYFFQNTKSPLVFVIGIPITYVVKILLQLIAGLFVSAGRPKSNKRD